MLQPAAHILLQVGEEVRGCVSGLSAARIWARPADAAPIGFHVLHLAGSLDRLLTYARGDTLSDAQHEAIAAEKSAAEAQPSAEHLLFTLDGAITSAVAQIASMTESAALAPRVLGRARIPTNALGLLMHAAEHSARHAGQIATLARFARVASP